jgi:protein SCO1/2
MTHQLRRSFLTGVLGAAWALSACAPAKPSFKSFDLTGADYALGFDLTDQRGQRRSLADFKGRVVMVFFGYTQCPDACPAAMFQLAELKRGLGDKGEKVQGVFVTIDPERDSPEMLKAYVENFDPSFVALVPTLPELEAVTTHYKVYRKKVAGPTPTSYTMDHLAGFYIYDLKGRLRLFSRPNMATADLQSDVASLLEGR